MGFRDRCFRWYERIQPSLAPGLRYSQEIWQDVLFDIAPAAGRWLDLGCGRGILPSWRQADERRLVALVPALVGLDYDQPSLRENTSIQNRIRGDISHLPFRSESFELVTANMVFEHLLHPEDQLREIARVLRPGGRLVFHTPNLAGYTTCIAWLTPEFLKKPLIAWLENRSQDDVFETHYKINSSGAVEKAAASAGLIVESIEFITSSAEFIVIPPLMLIELVYLRLLGAHALRKLRPNLIVSLRRPASGSGS